MGTSRLIREGSQELPYTLLDTHLLNPICKNPKPELDLIDNIVVNLGDGP
jgi:hypothetical protein